MHVEKLESRTLLAAVPVGESYFSDAPLPGTVRTVATFGGLTYFGIATANVFDVFAPSQLWRTDGTAEGTEKIANLRNANGYTPDRYPFPVSNFTAAGNNIYFTVIDTPTTSELWKTDGTSNGTTRVRAMPSLLSSQQVKDHRLTAFDGKLYYLGSTLAGTTVTWELFSSENTSGISSRPGVVVDMTVFNNSLYIATSSGLWRSSGSVPSQVTTTGITSNLETFQGALYFGTAQGLFRSDGTIAGTTLVSAPSQLTSAINLRTTGNTLFFAGTQSGSGAELWRSDGTTPGTMMVRDIVMGSGSSSPTQLTAHGEKLYFVTAGELWSSDGSEAGTARVQNVPPESRASSPFDISAFDGHVYFTASTSAHGRELWRTDGSDEGTQRLTDIYGGPAAGVPSILESSVSGLYLGAVDPGAGYGLYRVTAYDAAPTAIKDMYAGALNKRVPHAITASGTMFFVGGHSQPDGGELYKVDANGAALVRDIVPGTNTAAIAEIAALADRVVFTATTTQGKEIWTSDGTAAGTTLLKDIYPGFNSSNPANLVSYLDRVYFHAREGMLSDGDIWRTDGTPAGTVKWSTTNFFNGTAILGDWLYLTSSDTLWRTNGLINQTIKVFNQQNALRDIAPIDQKLYFGVNKSTNSPEAWLTDGTSTGTKLIKVFSSVTSSPPGGFMAGGEWVLFLFYNNTLTTELWRTNGSSAGTMAMKDVPGMPVFNNIGTRISAFGKGLFAASDTEHGQELWISDGTAAGTYLLKDIAAGPSSSRISGFCRCGDYIYFTANDGMHGRELWVTDGTPGGTFMVSDMLVGPEGSDPDNLTDVNGTLWFTANDGDSCKWFKIAPPTVSTGNDYAVSAGWRVALNGSATNIDPDEAHTYAWDLDGDGIFGETGAAAQRGDETVKNPQFDAVGLGAGAFPIALRVTDSIGLASVATGTVNVGSLSIAGQYALSGGVLRLEGVVSVQADLGVERPSLLMLVMAGSQVVLNASQHIREVRLEAGSQVAVASDGERMLAVKRLEITADAILDLRDNFMVIDYDSAYPPGAWDPQRVITSMPPAQGPAPLTTLGVAEAAQLLHVGPAETISWNGATIDATSLIVAYTYAGDADLNRRIDADDYFRIDRGYALAATGYTHGDFNSSGQIDADDYWLIDLNYLRAETETLSRPTSLIVGAPGIPTRHMLLAEVESAFHRLAEDDAAT